MAKNYLVVGGGSGIGKSVVQKLIDAGNIVYAASRNIHSADLPTEVKKVNFDVLEDESIDGLPDSLDGMVYCPGSISLKPFNRIKLEDFRSELELNFIGAIKVSQLVINALKKSGNASVVFYSTVAVQSGLPFHASIAGAKGALEGLTRSLAAEYAPKVRFNAIAPSLTDTPLAESLLSSDKKREANADRHPLKRVGTPNDMAAMTAFLLGEDASWISGQVIKIDGGMSAIKGM